MVTTDYVGALYELSIFLCYHYHESESAKAGGVGNGAEDHLTPSVVDHCNIIQKGHTDWSLTASINEFYQVENFTASIEHLNCYQLIFCWFSITQPMGRFTDLRDVLNQSKFNNHHHPFSRKSLQVHETRWIDDSSIGKIDGSNGGDVKKGRQGTHEAAIMIPAPLPGTAWKSTSHFRFPDHCSSLSATASTVRAAGIGSIRMCMGMCMGMGIDMVMGIHFLLLLAASVDHQRLPLPLHR